MPEAQSTQIRNDLSPAYHQLFRHLRSRVAHFVELLSLERRAGKHKRVAENLLSSSIPRFALPGQTIPFDSTPYTYEEKEKNLVRARNDVSVYPTPVKLMAYS
jgi:hypothetical protein